MSLSEQKPVRIRVHFGGQLCADVAVNRQLQIGRQRVGEALPFNHSADEERLILAPLDKLTISREHLLITCNETESGPDARVRIKNLSRSQMVHISNQPSLPPLSSIEIDLPASVQVDEYTIQLSDADDQSEPTSRELQQGFSAKDLRQTSLLQFSSQPQLSSDQLLHWLNETMQVLRSAAGRSDYWEQAVEAVGQIIGLDTIVALRRRGSEWIVEAVNERASRFLSTGQKQPSKRILDRMLQSKETIRELPESTDLRGSLIGIEAIVASPIFDSENEIIGAIVGTRESQPTKSGPQISDLEAAMVEVIAGSTATGIAREHEARKAIETRIQFEQFFTPELVRELERNPSMLEGQQAEITVLFCDVVRFSSISSALGSRTGLRWISEVMDYLSETVFQQQGVVVDYVGDEMMAMWGAPQTQVDHAARACQTAVDIFAVRAEIDRKWLDITGEPIDFCIGICSGSATVGNTGSRRKFKYGPLGNTVNIASRLQGLAKHLSVPVVISEATANAIKGTDRLTRPLGRAKLVNINNAVGTFELFTNPDEAQIELARNFESVVECLKGQKIEEASSLLNELAVKYPEDGPVGKMLAQLQAFEPNRDHLWGFAAKSPEI